MFEKEILCFMWYFKAGFISEYFGSEWTDKELFQKKLVLLKWIKQFEKYSVLEYENQNISCHSKNLTNNNL